MSSGYSGTLVESSNRLFECRQECVGVVEVHLLAAHEVYGLVSEELCPDVEHALTTHRQLRYVHDATSQPGNSSIR